MSQLWPWSPRSRFSGVSRASASAGRNPAPGGCAASSDRPEPGAGVPASARPVRPAVRGGSPSGSGADPEHRDHAEWEDRYVVNTIGGVTPIRTATNTMRQGDPDWRLPRLHRDHPVTTPAAGAASTGGWPACRGLTAGRSGGRSRGFEPRMGANPNCISSSFGGPKAAASQFHRTESAQVRGVTARRLTETGGACRTSCCATSVPPAREPACEATGSRCPSLPWQPGTGRGRPCLPGTGALPGPAGGRLRLRSGSAW